MRNATLLIGILAGCGGSGSGGGSGSSALPILDMDITDSHACAIRAADGTVWCWGENQYGELGDGTTTNRATPGQVQGIVGAVQVEVRERTGCARLGSGAVWCWGGQRPDPTTPAGGPRPTTERLRELMTLPPTETPFWSEATHISLAMNAACALRRDGSVRCYDQLNLPVEVEALRGSTLVEAGFLSATGVVGTKATYVNLVTDKQLEAKPYEFGGDVAFDAIEGLAFGEAPCLWGKIKGLPTIACGGPSNSLFATTLRRVPMLLDFQIRELAVARTSGKAISTKGRLAAFATQGSDQEMELRLQGDDRDHVVTWAGPTYTCEGHGSGRVTCLGTLRGGAPPSGKLVLPAVGATK